MIFKKYKVQVPLPYQAKSWTPLWRETSGVWKLSHFISCSWFGFSLDKTKTNSSSKIRDDTLFENCLSCCGHNATSKGCKFMCLKTHLLFQTLQPSKLVKLQHHSTTTCKNMSKFFPPKAGYITTQRKAEGTPVTLPTPPTPSDKKKGLPGTFGALLRIPCLQRWQDPSCPDCRQGSALRLWVSLFVGDPLDFRQVHMLKHIRCQRKSMCTNLLFQNQMT